MGAQSIWPFVLLTLKHNSTVQQYSFCRAAMGFTAVSCEICHCKSPVGLGFCEISKQASLAKPVPAILYTFLGWNLENRANIFLLELED